MGLMVPEERVSRSALWPIFVGENSARLSGQSLDGRCFTEVEVHTIINHY